MSNAIDIENLHICYRMHNGISIKSLFTPKQENKIEMVHAVKGVTFSVKTGSVLGIIGKNGSGKSTMLRSIAGVFSPDQGTIELHGNQTSLLSLGVGFKSELTGRENAILSGLLLGFTMPEVEAQLPAIIEFAEIGEFIDAPVKTYSSGMYSKLAFAVATSLKTDILLIDEVLSVGDENFRVRSFNRINELIADKNRTVVIVSHSIPMLETLCDEVLWLQDGLIQKIGEPKAVLKEYAEYMQ